MEDDRTETFEPPTLTRVGSLEELTLAFKDFTGSDGFILVQGLVALGPVS